jgi:hypothetical protein
MYALNFIIAGILQYQTAKVLQTAGKRWIIGAWSSSIATCIRPLTLPAVG